MATTVHIIEPTLESRAGHCHSFIESLCRESRLHEDTICVWGGENAALPGVSLENIRLEKHFFRKLRRIQEFFLLRRLLARPGRIFISTAGRIDLALLNWATSGPIPPNKVFFYFHWVRVSERKLSFFKKIALRYPDLVIMGPTESVVQVFSRCGFKNSMVVPYPITPAKADDFPAVEFRHLLFAGAARQDKGFSHIVDLLEYLTAGKMAIPVSLQTSAGHYDKFDADTKADLQRLGSIHYPHLRIQPETLDSSAYFDLFRGAICLQPYKPSDFADRISGVSLDALSMGAPLVTTSGTWMSRIVSQYDAGIVIDNPGPEGMITAVRSISSDFGRYQRNAFKAGAALQQAHSAGHLLKILTA